MSADVAAQSAKQRQMRITLLLQTMVESREKVLTLITEARTLGDHVALGYASWTAYVTEAYGGLLADLRREDRREVVLTLTEAGMSTRAIAPIVGVSKSVVDRDKRLSQGGTVERPDTVTSLDGRERPAIQPERRKPKGLPITDAFHDATYAMSRAATRLEDLHKDVRFTNNADALQKHKVDLFRARTILGRVIADLDGPRPLP